MHYRNQSVSQIAGAALLLLGAGRVLAADVTVTASQGTVTINQADHVIPAPVASKLTLPIEVHTGATGSVDLEQMGSKIHVGPNSVLVIPAPVASQGIVDRIVQQAGYALYNIKSRKEHPLAVQTPYLVSVVKGTVFTIAVEDHASTVALMEGSLDISAPGVAEHVLLKPNESVRHAEGEAHLSAHTTTPTSFIQSGGGTPPMAEATPDAGATPQMAQVARDFADAGAAVAPSQLVNVSRVPPAGQVTSSQPAGGGASSSGSAGGPSGSGSSSSASTSAGSSSGNSGAVTSTGDSTGTGTSTSTSTSAGSGSTGTGSTGTGSTGTGSASTTTGSSSSASAAGATGTDSGSTSGSSSSGTVTMPSSGSSTSTSTTTTTTTGCNGKSNGTGAGKCLGHSKG